ncbi:MULTISPECIES: DUF6503 family protein [Flavobacteriaceae]|uniref:DUF6503 family protein n=1 Tax=Flavobacteriaceae TaxID=49546 RepID=UPI0014914090|nr:MULTISPECIES: DUF6503 family protein [Allomuricauda]MDC6364942.1 deoxyribose-phosphate aldolase [Muricauda sp. AC10]
MKRYLGVLFILMLVACKQSKKTDYTAQEIIDTSIEVTGGEKFNNHTVSFMFRDRKYVSQQGKGKKVLQRITFLDSIVLTDVLSNGNFQRFVNDSLSVLSDSIANRYANSVNSVHYFARLPFGLNDAAVNKELLGKETIKGQDYYKIKVTFHQEGGGEDFDDTYVYWFDQQTFKSSYLAYDFHVNGGGQRFREAYNERYINGIRFVDYINYKPKNKGTSILEIGKLFEQGGLEELSKIELAEIAVQKN